MRQIYVDNKRYLSNYLRSLNLCYDLQILHLNKSLLLHPKLYKICVIH